MEQSKDLKSNRVRRNLGLLFVALICGLSTYSVSAQGPRGTILNRMDAHYKALSSLECKINLENVNTQLRETDERNGKIIFLQKTKKNALYMRLDWDKPDESALVIGEKFWLYSRERNLVYTGNKNNAPKDKRLSALSFLSMSKAQLTANFEVVVLEEGKLKDGTNTIHLGLVPKTAAKFKKVDLWVDGDGMPRRVMTTEENSDSSTILLTNIKKNSYIDAGLFDLHIPPGVKKQPV